MPSFLPDDPLWTAYVLNELSDAERAACEAELAVNPAAQAAVAELRELTAQLQAELEAEPCPAPTADLIESRLEPQPQKTETTTMNSPKKSRKWGRRLSWAALAASVLVVISMSLPAVNMVKEAFRREPAQNADVKHSAEAYKPEAFKVDWTRGDASKSEEKSYYLKDNGRYYQSTSNSGSNNWLKSNRPASGAPGRGYDPSVLNTATLTDLKAKPQMHDSEYIDRVDAASIPFQFPQQSEPSNTDAFDHVKDNEFLKVIDNPLSTFSADVDTGAYSILRGFLTQQHRLPPPGAVRIEELLNYFHYNYAPPQDETPFAVHTEVAGCPWQPNHRLLRIGLKGKEIPKDKRPASNIVFLIDVSGSMSPPNRLQLIKDGLQAMVQELSEKDRVAIVVYAGSSGLVLPSTVGDLAGKRKILASLQNLQAGGSTNGAQGIQLAYEVALQNFIKEGSNRVILATDGDFNVGVTNQDELIRLIEAKAKSGVFLTCLGVGYGNLKDSTLEKLADKGNGHYAYLDDILEAKKVLVDEMCGTLYTIAKDVKLQLEFNPGAVASYRLIGYENRVLAKEDFNNDKKDAGDIGAGHTVTALYEIVPAAKDAKSGPRGEVGTIESPLPVNPAVDPLKYQKPAELSPAAASGELLTLKLRYKQPDGEKSKLLEFPVKDAGQAYGQASGDFKFASAVAAFGMVLRQSPHKGAATLDLALELAGEGLGNDEGGYRHEFVELLRQAKQLGK